MTVTSLHYVSGPPDDAALEGLVALDDLKLHLRIDHASEDAELRALRAAAVAKISGPSGIGVALTPERWRMILRGWSGEIGLPVVPVTRIEAVEYIAPDYELHILDPSQYRPALDGDTASVMAFHGWPATAPVADAVRIEFEAGYTAGTAPPDLVQAIRLLVAHWYRHREAAAPLSVREMPLSVLALIGPHRRSVVA